MLLLVACAGPGPDLRPRADDLVRLADGKAVVLRELFGTRGTVILTLDPECPFSRTYAMVIDSLARAYATEGVRFVGVYPTSFITPDAAQAFAAEARFDFAQVMDADCRLSNALQAEVMPEAFVLDTDADLVYRGAIDDSAVRPGRRRPGAVHDHLADVLEALTTGVVIPASTKAVGCRVECEPA